jgi:hypothetical protein
VKWEYLNDEGKGCYAFGSLAKRDCILMFRKTAKQVAESIEYFI